MAYKHSIDVISNLEIAECPPSHRIFINPSQVFKTLLKDFGNEFHTWGMTVILVLRSWRSSWAISCPSIRMAPSAASTSRSNPTARLDFPAPVLPVMPICKVQWKDFGFDVDCFLTVGQTCHVLTLLLLMRDSFAQTRSLGLFVIYIVWHYFLKFIAFTVCNCFV
ncbi:hypothetical protein Nmel_014654 [Mimus melanotis]